MHAVSKVLEPLTSYYHASYCRNITGRFPDSTLIKKVNEQKNVQFTKLNRQEDILYITHFILLPYIYRTMKFHKKRTIVKNFNKKGFESITHFQIIWLGYHFL